MSANLENSAVATGPEKISFHSNLKEKQCHRMFPQLHLSHTLAKKCSQFSKPGFHSMWTVNFQMFKLDLEKAEEPEIKLPISTRSWKKKENLKKKKRKTSVSALLTMPKPLTVWITTNCGKFFRDGNSRPPGLSPEKSVYRSRSNN